MKKLVYFWCDELRGFEDKEFNFSSKYNIEYNPLRVTLTINKGDPNYIDHFFGDHIELNVIVGNNGVGKSSMFKKLFRIIRRHPFAHAQSVLVFEEKDGLSAYFIVSSRIEYQRKIEFSQLDKDNTFEFCDRQKLFDHFDNPDISYLTQLFDMEMYEDGFVDDDAILSGNYSIGGLMRDKSVFPLYADKKIPEGKKLWAKKFWLHLNFLKHFAPFSANTIDLPFAVPGGVWVSIDDRLIEVLSSLSSEPSNSDENYDRIELMVRASGFAVAYSLFDMSVTSTYNCFMSALLASLLSHLSLMPESEIHDLCDRNQCSSLYELVSGWLQSDELREKKGTAEKLAYIFDELSASDPDGLYSYRKLLVLFQNASWKPEYYALGNEFYIPLNADVSLSEFFRAYASLEGDGFLDFSWGMSSGETAMLDLYSKFYHISQSTINKNRRRKATQYKGITHKKKQAEPITDILLLIDEADACFHPQWQKEYVKDTLSVAGQIFQGFDVQILLATHSPIMLSDVPKQNVLYLKKENKETGAKVIPREKRQETFGTDIFSLFKDSFFLEGSGIGSFAEDKLAELLRVIHSLRENQESNMSPEEILRRIQCIGDPFIRRKFENEFEKYTKSDTRAALQNRRALLLSELAQIERELGENRT